MIREYLQQRRSEILPFVKDWTADHNEIRLEKNVNKLNWEEWFWLHPSSYKLVILGSHITTMLFFLVAGILSLIKQNYIFFIFNLIFILLLGKELIKHYRILKANPNFTIYDYYLRDY